LRSSVEIPFDKTSKTEELEFAYQPKWPLLNGKPVTIYFTDSVKGRVEFSSFKFIDTKV